MSKPENESVKIRPGVLLQVGELAEAFLAVRAAVGFDAEVDAQVLRQVRGVGEGLGAVRALVSLGLCVRLGVNLHVGLGEEGQRTNFTPATETQRQRRDEKISMLCHHRKVEHEWSSSSKTRPGLDITE